MPNHLDLTLSSRHGSMLLPPSPRMTLRRMPSFSKEYKEPMSSSSSRFSFNHLYQTPPPSPSLPALVPRHGKSVPSAVPRRFFRAFLILTGLASFIYAARLLSRSSMSNVNWSNDDSFEYEMVGDDSLPDYPTPVVVTDRKGNARWTISIPLNYDFPLAPEEYAEICRQAREAGDHVSELHGRRKTSQAEHAQYFRTDPYFVDVAEAEEYGLLSDADARMRSANSFSHVEPGNVIGEQKGDLIQSDVCSKSLTFVMEAGDAGLGQTLMMLWTAYGMAQREGRGFFIDDSRWAYGKYDAYFKIPPNPHCRPPARHEMLPCPRHARHLIVSTATSPWTFGDMFTDHFEDSNRVDVRRQEQIFGLIRIGYEALFRVSDDLQYINTRIAEMQAKTIPVDPANGEGLVIGVHVRHGDRHPFQFQYVDSHIPLDRYTEQISALLSSPLIDRGDVTLPSVIHSPILLASDDPQVYTSSEFSTALRAQTQILLTTESSTTQIPSATSPTTKSLLTDTTDLFSASTAQSTGWEGGFFSGVFWSLGRATPAVAGEPANSLVAQPANAEAQRLRQLVGRAYIMDLAILGGASDAVICTVSSTTCRLLAVMLGWERAIEQKRWINVDGDYEWRGFG